MKTFINESAESLNVMTEVQEEQVQGGFKSVLQEETSYGVVTSNNLTASDKFEDSSVSPWVITF